MIKTEEEEQEEEEEEEADLVRGQEEANTAGVQGVKKTVDKVKD